MVDKFRFKERDGLSRGKLGKTKSIKQEANDHEKELAKKLGGTRQSNSGALAHAKGDVKLTDFLLDSKQTKHNSIIVSGMDLTKITREADGEGRYPGLILTVDAVPSTVEKEWICIPLDVFSKYFTKDGNA